MSDNTDEVVLYWRPMCTFCMKLRTTLLFSGLRFRKVNIWNDPRAAAFVRSVAGGNETVPTVDVAGEALVNPTLRELLATVRRRAPHALTRP